MNRKNAFSYFIWFLYSALVCGGLFGMMVAFSRRLGQSQTMGVIVGAGWLFFCGLLTVGIYKLVNRISSRKLKSPIVAIVAESLGAVILVAVGLAIRILCIGNIRPESAYFDMAQVSAEHGIPTLVHGAEHIYLQLLHLVYVVFGNRYVAGIWLQIVLQLLAGVFLYLAVRKMAGRVSPLVALGFFALSPLMINEALMLSPRMLFLVIFAFALYLCTKCICDRRGSIACMLAGAISAVVCYLDILGVLLLVFSVIGIVWTKNRADASVKRNIIAAIGCIISCVAVFLLMIAVDALASTKMLGSVLNAWWGLFAPSSFAPLGLVNRIPVAVEVLILVMLLTFGIFSFWTGRKTERQSIWTLTIIVLLLLVCFGMTTEAISGVILLFVLVSALAGIGVTGVGAGEIISCSCIWDDGGLEAQLEAMSQDIDEVLSDSEVPSVEEVQEEAPKVQLIENPLPLPKKHVKKIMDFDYELQDGMDDFDIEVDENDDFDI